MSTLPSRGSGLALRHIASRLNVAMQDLTPSPGQGFRSTREVTDAPHRLGNLTVKVQGSRIPERREPSTVIGITGSSLL